MRKSKRVVSYDGSTYKVRSDKIEIPDFAAMERMQVLMWLNTNTYARGYSRQDNSLQGLGGAINLGIR